MRPHDDAVVELLREDPAFADDIYLPRWMKQTNPAGVKHCWRHFDI